MTIINIIGYLDTMEKVQKRTPQDQGLNSYYQLRGDCKTTGLHRPDSSELSI